MSAAERHSPRADATDSAPPRRDSDELDETTISSNDGNVGETDIQDDTSEQTEKSSARSESAEEQQPVESSASRATPGKTAPAKSKKVHALGEFKLLKKLGQGGMGEVFLATQSSLDRKVAIKVLAKQFARKEDFVKRFYREAKSMARIDHSHVVRCYSVGEDKGIHYVAIEYIDGQSMQDWMNQLGKLNIGDALHVILRCADALSHAHGMNLVHRDIKPDNMLVTKSGVVKVSDLGLAKALDEDVSVTQSGTGMGTPLYMSPEQARNAKHVDYRTDIYALGATLYYFLTGKHPFTGENTLELIMAKEEGRFTPARRLNNEIPERLDLMIDKLLAKDPDHRYKSCDEIIADLGSLQLESPVLSFIDSKAAAVPRTASVGSRAAINKAAVTIPSGIADSAQDAQRNQSKKSSRMLWYVRHTSPAGKVIVSRLSSEQIQQSLRGGQLGLDAKGKKSAKGEFLPLGQFPEFADLVEKQAVKTRVQKRSQSLQQEFAKIEKQYDRQKIWRKLRNMTESALGLVQLALYLGVIGGVGYLGYLFIPSLYRMIAAQLGLDS